MTIKRLLSTVLFLTSFGLLTTAAQEDPLEIIRMVEEKQSADTTRSEISMIVYPDLHDKSDHRDMRILSWGRGDDESYMEFLAPRSIKGLRMLSKDGDQWVFFPSTGRVRKIAAKSKDQSVKGVGGDFSYEDFSGGSIEEKYDLSIQESSTEVWVLEGNAKEEDSTYDRILITIDKDKLIMMKIEYFTDEDGHYKDLIIKEVKTVGGREIPTQMIMVNRKKESMTVIVTHSSEFDIPVEDRYFNPTRFYR